MQNLTKGIRQISVILAFLTLWASFAWGLPGEGGITASEDVAAPAPADPWAGVRISDAYDYAMCPQCGKKNEIRAETCARCGYELPQPSLEITNSDMVFVPGQGYYKEGTLLEEGKTRKGMLTAGFVLTATGVGAFLVMAAVAPALDETGEGALFLIFPAIMALGAIGLGGGLLIVGLVTRKEPVYAFANGDGFEPYEGTAYAVRSRDVDGLAFKVEVTALGF